MMMTSLSSVGGAPAVSIKKVGSIVGVGLRKPAPGRGPLVWIPGRSREPFLSPKPQPNDAPTSTSRHRCNSPAFWLYGVVRTLSGSD